MKINHLYETIPDFTVDECSQLSHSNDSDKFRLLTYLHNINNSYKNETKLINLAGEKLELNIYNPY